MNKQTHFFIKIYLSDFILDGVNVSVVCKRWMERYILRERTSSSCTFFQEPVGNDCTPFQARQRRLWSVACPSLICDSLQSAKSDRVILITWSPSGFTPVQPKLPDAPSSSCLLIKMWRLATAHGVTSYEPKIHVNNYITKILYCKWWRFLWKILLKPYLSIWLKKSRIFYHLLITVINKDWNIDFNGMSTHLELFYVKRLRYCVHFTCIFTFLRGRFLKDYLPMVIWCQVFLSATDNFHIYLTQRWNPYQ